MSFEKVETLIDRLSEDLQKQREMLIAYEGAIDEMTAVFMLMARSNSRLIDIVTRLKTRSSDDLKKEAEYQNKILLELSEAIRNHTLVAKGVRNRIINHGQSVLEDSVNTRD